MSTTKVRSDLVDFSTPTTLSNTVTLNSNLIVSNNASLVANGSSGTAGYVLTSNGTSMFWSSPKPLEFGYSIIFGG